jgi:hypothetical protein
LAPWKRTEARENLGSPDLANLRVFTAKDGVYNPVETRTGASPGHEILSLRAAAKQSPAAQVGIASSLALLAMTGEPDTVFPPKMIHNPAKSRLAGLPIV